MERLRLVNRRTGGRFEEHRESLRESPKQSLGSSLVTGSPGRFDLAAQPDDNTTGERGTLWHLYKLSFHYNYYIL